MRANLREVLAGQLLEACYCMCILVADMCILTACGSLLYTIVTACGSLLFVEAYLWKLIVF